LGIVKKQTIRFSEHKHLQRPPIVDHKAGINESAVDEFCDSVSFLSEEGKLTHTTNLPQPPRVIALQQRPNPEHMGLIQIATIRVHDVHPIQRNREFVATQDRHYARFKRGQEGQSGGERVGLGFWACRATSC
jgi:hypothetical protein